MIQRVGKGENSITSIFDTDWNQFAKEAETINDKYNEKKEEEVRVAKQTSGSMYSTQNQHRINFPFDENGGVIQPEAKQENFKAAAPSNRLQRDFDPNKNSYTQSSKSVSSVEHTASEGSNKKYTKIETSNSIWDSDKLKRLAGVKDYDPAEEKAAIAEERRTMRQSAHDKIVENLSSVDQRKASQVNSITSSEEADSKYIKAKANLSIFDNLSDNQEFNRLPEQTAGEKIAEQKKERKEHVAQDTSWKENSKVVSSKSVVSSLFDSLFS